MTKVHTIHFGETRDWQRRIIFLSEAYGENEEEKYVGDVERLVGEVFEESLGHVKPFIAVEAIWTPSSVSGVPRLSRAPRRPETAFGLFRDAAAPLRLVEPGPRSYQLARSLCGQTFSRELCTKSVLVLLANDPYYGGLGDDIIIITNSQSSGALALRHELGHVLGDVGEEYDAGSDYSGANFATRPIPCPKHYKPRIETSFDGVQRTIYDCAQWLDIETTPKNATLAFAEWPWQPPPYTRTFQTPQADHRWLTSLELSIAGGLEVRASLRTSESHQETRLVLTTTQDQKSLANQLDRRFYSAQTFLRPGTIYTLRIHEDFNFFLDEKKKNASTHPWSPHKVMCHIQVHLEDEALATINPTALSVFPVFNQDRNLVGYRPTRCSCLMREVAAGQFCQCCRDLILRRLLASTDPLSQLRIRHNFADTQLAPLVQAGLVNLRWLRHDQFGQRTEDVSKRDLPLISEPGCWTLIARFTSPHLLTHRLNLLEARSSFSLAHHECILAKGPPTTRLYWRRAPLILEDIDTEKYTSSSSPTFSLSLLISTCRMSSLLAFISAAFFFGLFLYKRKRSSKRRVHCTLSSSDKYRRSNSKYTASFASSPHSRGAPLEKGSFYSTLLPNTEPPFSHFRYRATTTG